MTTMRKKAMSTQSKSAPFTTCSTTRYPPHFDWNVLDRQCTYMFELLHPQQLIVVEHDTPRLVHIGTRNNRTLIESYEPLFAPETAAASAPLPPTPVAMVEQARTFALSTRDDCIAAASALGAEQEGFVVVDAQWNRVKIKGPVYVALHHAAGGLSSCSVRQCAADIFLNGESEEVRSYRLRSRRLANVSVEIDRIEKQFSDAAASLQSAYDKIRRQALSSSAAGRQEEEKLVNTHRKGCCRVCQQVVRQEQDGVFVSDGAGERRDGWPKQQRRPIQWPRLRPCCASDSQQRLRRQRCFYHFCPTCKTRRAKKKKIKLICCSKKKQKE
jgi:hypothetical protein